MEKKNEKSVNETLIKTGEIMLIVGLPQVGKTAFATLLAGSMLNPEPVQSNLYFFSPKTDKKKRIVFIDTSNSLTRAEKNYAEIKTRAGDNFDPNELVYINLTGWSIEGSLNRIMEPLAKGGVKALIIDDIDALVPDINSAREANMLINLLRSYNTAGFATIDRNVNVDLRRGAIGELGKRLERAADTIIDITDDEVDYGKKFIHITPIRQESVHNWFIGDFGEIDEDKGFIPVKF